MKDLKDMPLPLVANHWSGHSVRIQKDWSADERERLISPYLQIMESLGQIAIKGKR